MADEEDSCSGSSSSSSEEEEVEKSESEEEDVDIYSCDGTGYNGLDYDPWAIAREAKLFTVIGGGCIPDRSNLKSAKRVGAHRKGREYPVYKKSVSFCSDDRLEAIRDISPRRSSGTSDESESDEDEPVHIKGDAPMGDYNVRKSNNSRNVVARITGMGYGSLQRSTTRSSLNKIGGAGGTSQPSKRPKAARPHHRAGRGRKPHAASGFRSQIRSNTTNHNTVPKFRMSSSSASSQKDGTNSSWNRLHGSSSYGDKSFLGNSRVRSSSARSNIISADSKNLVNGTGNSVKLDPEQLAFSLTATRVHPSPYRHGSAPVHGRRTDPSELSRDVKELRLGAGFGDVSDLKIDTRPHSGNNASRKVYAWHLANGTLQNSSQLETPCISQLWDSKHSVTSSSTTM